MKNLIIGLSLLGSIASLAADLSKSELQGSFTGENQIAQYDSFSKSTVWPTKYTNAYFSLKGDKLYTNLLDYEHLKCVALETDNQDYSSKMICQENGDAPKGDVFILHSKRILKNKTYVNVQSMGSFSTTLINEVEETGFMGSSEGELSFVLIKN